MTSFRTLHPATGNVVEVIAVDETFEGTPDNRPISTVVTYRTTLPTGFEVVGSYTIEPGTNPAYLPDAECPCRCHFPHAAFSYPHTCSICQCGTT